MVPTKARPGRTMRLSPLRGYPVYGARRPFLQASIPCRWRNFKEESIKPLFRKQSKAAGLISISLYFKALRNGDAILVTGMAKTAEMLTNPGKNAYLWTGLWERIFILLPMKKERQFPRCKCGVISAFWPSDLAEPFRSALMGEMIAPGHSPATVAGGSRVVSAMAHPISRRPNSPSGDALIRSTHR